MPIMDMAKEPTGLDDRARRLQFSFVEADGRAGPAAREDWREDWRDGLDLRLLVSKLRARRRLLARGLVAGLCAGLAAAGLWLALRAPSWTASTEILVANTTLQLSGQDAVVTQLMVENTLLQSQMLLARSHAVMERAIEQMGEDRVRAALPRPAAPSPASSSLSWRPPFWPFAARAGGAAESGRGAREALVLALKDAVAVQRSGASQVIVLRARAVDADGAVRLAGEVSRAFIAENRAINAVVTTSGAFRERIQVLGPTARLISEPVRPLGRDGPRALLVLAAAPLAGALAGLLAAALAALASRRVWSAEQLTQRTGGEFFGHVPDAAGLARGRDGAHDGEHDLPAALRRIRAAALEKRRKRPRLVGVTSAGGDRGHTTVAKGFALLLARSGQRVLLADAAFAERGLTRGLALEGERGLAEILREPGLLRQVARGSLQPDLDILAAGLAPGDPDPLWPALPRALAAHAERVYDWVILDLPPLSPPSAIRAAGAAIDDLILVVRSGAVVGSDLEEAVAALGLTRERLLGVMLSTGRDHGWRRLAALARSARRRLSRLRSRLGGAAGRADGEAR